MYGKYLEVKYQDVCNLLSNGSTMHIYKEKGTFNMAKC